MVITKPNKKISKIQTSNYYVAYLDFLGTKKFMLNDNNDEFMNKLYSLYYNTRQKILIDKFNFNKNAYLKIFSDNIILAVEVENDNKDKKNLSVLLRYVANVYNSAIKQGLLIRGGISKGAFCIDNLMVGGQAHIEAVLLEENIAVYPRIVTKKEVNDVLPNYFIKSEDGFYFLNNFMLIHSPDEIKKVRENLLNMLRTCTDNKVFQKIMWVIHYFNEYFGGFYYPNNETPVIAEDEIIKMIK